MLEKIGKVLGARANVLDEMIDVYLTQEFSCEISTSECMSGRTSDILLTCVLYDGGIGRVCRIFKEEKDVDAWVNILVEWIAEGKNEKHFIARLKEL